MQPLLPSCSPGLTSPYNSTSLGLILFCPPPKRRPSLLFMRRGEAKGQCWKEDFPLLKRRLALLMYCKFPEKLNIGGASPFPLHLLWLHPCVYVCICIGFYVFLSVCPSPGLSKTTLSNGETSKFSLTALTSFG